MSLTRREMLGLTLAAVLCPTSQPAEAQRFVNRTGLQAGQFVWEPSHPAEGPVVIIASLADRLVHVYRAGVLVGISTCEVGRRGRRTPTGVFVIDQPPDGSDREGRQIAWTGRALHAANIQGFPASLGCVRVPAAFARLLAEVVLPGTLVILADRRTEPMDVVHSGTLFPVAPVHEASAIVRTVAARPISGVLSAGSDEGHVAIVISRASRMAVLMHDGAPERTQKVRFTQPSSRVGTHVYSLIGATPADDGLIWLGFGIGRSGRERHLVSWQGDALLDQISFEDRAGALAMTQALHAGATLVVTDEPAPQGRRKSPQHLVLLSTPAPVTRVRPAAVRRVRRQRRRRPQTWANSLLNSWR